MPPSFTTTPICAVFARGSHWSAASTSCLIVRSLTPILVLGGEVVYSAGEWASHHSLYRTLVLGQNQGSVDLEANVTHRCRGMALHYTARCSRPSGWPSAGSSISPWAGASASC